MDNAVALVQAYLRVNGYFTVAEYPVIEAMRGGRYRSLTDIDILAFRFPGAGRPIRGRRRRTVDVEHHAPDPLLGRPGEMADMLVGEVKEGRARLNPAARDPAVLRAALVRFGCCTEAEAPRIVSDLARRGEATTPGDIRSGWSCSVRGGRIRSRQRRPSSRWGTSSPFSRSTSANTGNSCGTLSSTIRFSAFSLPSRRRAAAPRTVSPLRPTMRAL